MVEYKNLDDLIFQDGEARQYYNELPKYIREQIQTRADNVKTYESLRNYADNLLNGDI